MRLVGRRALMAGALAMGAARRRARGAEPIRLGASLALTGRLSDSAKYTQEGYLLWLDQTNAAGGIDGRPVALTIYDDESSPDTGRVLAQRLIDRDGVLALLGPYASPITDAAAVVAERAEVPMVASLASDSSIWSRRKLRWSVQAFPSSAYDHQGFLEILKLKGQGLRKLAIVFEETPFSIGSKDWAARAATEQGLTVDTYGYTPGAQDFRSIIERMVGFGAEAVSMGGYYEPSIALTRQMIERGFNPTAYNFIQAADGVSKNALGANIEGIFGRSAWEASMQAPASRAFATAYEARFKRVPSYHSAAGYAGGELIGAAIRAKGADRPGLREFLAAQSVQTVLGTYRVNERGQQEGYRYVAIQWQDGASKIVWPQTSNAIIWPKPNWS